MRRALVSRVLAATAATAVVLLAGAVPAGALTRDPFQPTGGAAPVAAGSGSSATTSATTSAPSSTGSGGTTATTSAQGSAGSGGTTATTAAPAGGQSATAGPGGATTPAGTALPVTGSRTSGPLLLGLFSLVVGGALAYVGRRRWDARRYVRC